MGRTVLVLAKSINDILIQQGLHDTLGDAKPRGMQGWIQGVAGVVAPTIL